MRLRPSKVKQAAPLSKPRPSLPTNAYFHSTYLAAGGTEQALATWQLALPPPFFLFARSQPLCDGGSVPVYSGNLRPGNYSCDVKPAPPRRRRPSHTCTPAGTDTIGVPTTIRTIAAIRSWQHSRHPRQHARSATFALSTRALHERRNRKGSSLAQGELNGKRLNDERVLKSKSLGRVCTVQRLMHSLAHLPLIQSIYYDHELHQYLIS